MKTKRTTKLEHGRHADETAMEFLRRLIGWLDNEPENLLDELPTVESIIEYFGLWKTYQTEFLSGILQCIDEGDDPKPFKSFIKKWNLDWEPTQAK